MIAASSAAIHAARSPNSARAPKPRDRDGRQREDDRHRVGPRLAAAEDVDPDAEQHVVQRRRAVLLQHARDVQQRVRGDADRQALVDPEARVDRLAAQRQRDADEERQRHDRLGQADRQPRGAEAGEASRAADAPGWRRPRSPAPPHDPPAAADGEGLAPPPRRRCSRSAAPGWLVLVVLRAEDDRRHLRRRVARRAGRPHRRRVLVQQPGHRGHLEGAGVGRPAGEQAIARRPPARPRRRGRRSAAPGSRPMRARRRGDGRSARRRPRGGDERDDRNGDRAARRRAGAARARTSRCRRRPPRTRARRA